MFERAKNLLNVTETTLTNKIHFSHPLHNVKSEQANFKKSIQNSTRSPLKTEECPRTPRKFHLPFLPSVREAQRRRAPPARDHRLQYGVRLAVARGDWRRFLCLHRDNPRIPTGHSSPPFPS
jgi:hypothetical protein